MSQDTAQTRPRLGMLLLLAVLLSILIVGLGLLFLPLLPRPLVGPVRQTHTLLDRLAESLASESAVAQDVAALDMYVAEYSRQGGGKEPTNVGSELLHRALAAHGVLGGLPYVRESDTDEDGETPGAWTADMQEVADAWGNPVIVVFREWLGVLAGKRLAYRTNQLDDVLVAIPDLGDARFVLISMGADGLPGTEDDLTLHGR